MGWQKATLGTGCYGGVEAAFRRVVGATSTAVDFLGGTVKSPSADDE
ncbi:MAG: peptide-methionine (S)-S-oxide reductase [Planctomycetes bacterium]|nr:peptide-methionine (S)-S-oxide reductase [Planctomycetota bacterium]MCH8963764.1 peptide-methionine (S)-S-oxide reductase [Planctomycetota bacterium]